MSHCSGKTKAAITYNDKNGIERTYLVARDLPINIACGVGIRTGQYIITVRGSGFTAPGCSVTGLLNYTATYIADSYSVSPTLNHEYNRSTGLSCTAYDLTFYVGSSVVGTANLAPDYQVQQSVNPNYDSGNRELVITGNSGAELFRTRVSDCEYAITCDDDCPQGSHKCTHNKYPGYCCVPCQEVGNRLKSIASKVRG
jgi:hypothetical protein